MKSSTQKGLYVKRVVVDVAIITVCRNGFKETCRLVESLRKHIKSVTYRIIVVDDCSVKNYANVLLKKYPFIKAVRTLSYKGFSAACNIAANVVDSRYILFLKNDTYIDCDSFRIWLDAVDSMHIGASSPLILNATDGRIEYAGSTELTRTRLHRVMYHRGRKVEEVSLSIQSVPYLDSVAMMVRRDVYFKLGGPSGIYRGGYEDLDWSNMLQTNKYTLLLVPDVRIYHGKLEQNAGELPNTIYNETLGRLLFIYRNRTGLYQVLAHLYALFFVFPQKGIRGCSLKTLKAVLRAICSYCKMSKEAKMDFTHYRFSYFLPSG